jgi:hypothetical protein
LNQHADTYHTPDDPNLVNRVVQIIGVPEPVAVPEEPFEPVEGDDE